MKREEVREYLKAKIEAETRGLSVCLNDPVYIAITGNTYPYREYLKGLGFYWNPNSQSWRLFQVAD